MKDFNCIDQFLIFFRFHTDPSGTFTKYDAKAIGAGCEGANSQLMEEYRKEMSLNDALSLAMKILKSVMEEKLTAVNIEVSVVRGEGKYESFSTAQIEDLISKSQ